MPAMREALERLAVSGSSPDRCVTITVTGSPAKIDVELTPGYRSDHTEESLSRHVAAAVRIAMRAYQKHVTDAWAQAAGVAWDNSLDHAE